MIGYFIKEVNFRPKFALVNTNDIIPGTKHGRGTYILVVICDEAVTLGTLLLRIFRISLTLEAYFSLVEALR